MNAQQKISDRSIFSHVQEIVGHMDGFTLYEDSIHEKGEHILCIAKKGITKYLLVLSGNDEAPESDFKGKVIQVGETAVLRCDLTHENAKILRAKFDFTNARLIGKSNSYGFGDRLGIAGPAHIRAVKETGFMPILAQQSIRELERTHRTPEQVMEAASWAVFQEGYHKGFGADGDHLKTKNDMDRMVKAGYTMFTIDPSDFVVNEVKTMEQARLEKKYKALPWDDLETSQIH